MATETVKLNGGLFDSTSVTETVGGFPIGDKAVSSEFFAKLISCFFTDGVCGAESYKVAPSPSGGLKLSAAAGVCWIRGYMAWQKTATDISVSAGESYNITVRLNTAVGEFTLCAVPQSEGVKNTESVKELVIAEVAVPAGVDTVTEAMITDTRSDKNKCGVVTSTLDSTGVVPAAQNALMLGDSPASDFVKKTGCAMTGKLTAAPESTGVSAVRNISYGTSLPDSLPEGELFILITE